ncbi:MULTISPECIES: ABC transporter permease [Microbacterium]|uniref:Monosaccharide ABC transporter membrane protein, CUT2 family n=1 Tax=Microbacterium saccharophilum TaxID=1213358 RepID=A0A7Z7CXV6_9MICO|nr:MULTISPECIES: ABC transporter permease [Microbacterium]SFI49010.1 monosaccharide ABC transporter membrane protein, CUT2 family [Microbacterium saccharophilum]
MSSVSPTTTTVTVRPPRPAAQRIALSLLSRYALVILWIIMLLVLLALVPGDVSPVNAMRTVFSQITPVVFLALGVVITMSVGEFDLSFAGIFSISAVAVPSLAVLHGWPVPLAVLGALALALLAGAVNAALIVGLGINSVVVTLGVWSVAGGLAFLLSGETTVSGLDPALAAISTGRFVGLPHLFWYGVILVSIVAYVMGATPVGRHMAFVGSNRAVAALAGIAVGRVRVGAYLASALLAGLAGVVIALGNGGFNPASASAFLLPTFAAVFLGTVAVVPGRFNPIGMLIAAYFLITGVFGLQLLGLTGWVTEVFYGAALILAVTVSHLLQRRVKS